MCRADQRDTWEIVGVEGVTLRSLSIVSSEVRFLCARKVTYVVQQTLKAPFDLCSPKPGRVQPSISQLLISATIV